MRAGLRMMVITADTSPASLGTVVRGTGSPRAACGQTDVQGQTDSISISEWFNRSRLPWVLAVTAMSLHGLCCRKYFCPRCRVSTALCAEGFTDCSYAPNKAQKEGRDVISVGFVFVSNAGFWRSAPSTSHFVPSVRSCPRWEVPLLGRSERCCIQTLLRGGQQKGKKQQGK